MSKWYGSDARSGIRCAKKKKKINGSRRHVWTIVSIEVYAVDWLVYTDERIRDRIGYIWPLVKMSYVEKDSRIAEKSNKTLLASLTDRPKTSKHKYGPQTDTRPQLITMCLRFSFFCFFFPPPSSQFYDRGYFAHSVTVSRRLRSHTVKVPKMISKLPKAVNPLIIYTSKIFLRFWNSVQHRRKE
jgi:hypothetical protein